MKNKLYYALLPMLFAAGACQKLDREFVTDLSKDQIDVSYNRSTQLLTAVYTELRDGFAEIDGAMVAAATDEAEYVQEFGSVQNFNNGSWNAARNPNNVWPDYFRGIRKANLFLESAGKVNLDLYKLDPSINAQDIYKKRLYDISRWNYEARFLRAYFYFELVKRYGGVPIITSTLDVADVPNVKRNTLAECLKFISDECDSVATKMLVDQNGALNLIPIQYTSTQEDYGRVTRGVALALKSRAKLYAASELFNNPSWAGGYANPELISMTGGSRTQRWTEASDAALAAITAINIPTPLTTTYANLFSATSITNKDLIFVRRNSASNTFERANFPVGFANGGSGTNPSQNLVDAYEIREGSGANQKAVPFDWNNPVHVANLYNTSAVATANTRDPRLTLSIAVNGTQLINASGFSRNLEIFNGGLDGKPIANATKTGYYIKKYINNTTSGTAVHSWVFFRIAELFLNYAEARNQLNDQATARVYINYVRGRAGVNMPLIPTGLNQDDTQKAIVQERRVEFAFEDFRAWDVRRWMIAPQTLGAALRGVNIEKTSSTTTTYTPFVLENRVFDASKMYLYPIPQGDIISSNGVIKQNPGW